MHRKEPSTSPGRTLVWVSSNVVRRKPSARERELWYSRIRGTCQRVCDFVVIQAFASDIPRAKGISMSSVDKDLSHGPFQAGEMPKQNVPHHQPNFSTSTLTSRPSRNKEEQIFLTARFIPSGPEATTPILPRSDA